MDEEVSDLCEKVNNLSMDGIFASKGTTSLLAAPPFSLLRTIIL
jgi:hypothetical protein